jgi:hypothetical protein
MAIDRLALISAALRASDEARRPQARLEDLASVMTMVIFSSAAGTDDAHIGLDHVVRLARASINRLPDDIQGDLCVTHKSNGAANV